MVLVEIGDLVSEDSWLEEIFKIYFVNISKIRDIQRENIAKMDDNLMTS